LVGVLARHRRFIFWEVVLVTVGVTVFSLVAGPVFTSKAQILPPAGDEAGPMSLPSLMSSVGFNGMLRLGGSLRPTQASDLIAAILGSRTIGERVMDSCDFLSTIKGKKSRENALRALKGATRIGVTDEGIIALQVSGRSPAYATRLATSYISEADRFLRESYMSRGHNMRTFVGQRLTEVETELAAARESLVSFQKSHRITSVDEETRAAVDAYATLQAQKLAQDVELQFAEGVSGADNPYVQNLRQRNAEFDREVARLEQGDGHGRFGMGFGVPLSGVPDVAAEYARRLMNFRLKEELRSLLLQQYEQARISEVRDTPAITVLDPPRVPEQRSWPKRKNMVLLALVTSLIVGALVALLLEAWDQQKQNETTWQEWQRIAHLLGLDRGIGRRIFGYPSERS
jgi:capsule polysaccharide export protein KpsE/RkpR